MSSKRGRKRNDNLPPNRARDVQRAFRARRAAHLQALEHRVTELEEENTCLRQALNLPPANRAPLGKGPTGKDKPKSFETSSNQKLSSRDSSVEGSPLSTRANSLSPSAIPGSVQTSPRDTQILESSPWDQHLVMTEPTEPPVTASSSTSFQLPPTSAPLSQKSINYPDFPPSMSPPRNSIPENLYIPSSQPTFAHSTDRPMGSTYGSSAFLVRADPREESRQQSYTYNQQYPSHDGLPNPPHTAPLHSQPNHHQRENTSLPFSHRRSLTDSQGYSTIVNQFPHLPSPLQSHGVRVSPPRGLDGAPIPRSAAIYAHDGRMHTMT